MRVVIGSALIARASSRLWSDLPPMNVTIPAVLLIGAGILLIVRFMDSNRGIFHSVD